MPEHALWDLFNLARCFIAKARRLVSSVSSCRKHNYKGNAKTFWIQIGNSWTLRNKMRFQEQLCCTFWGCGGLDWMEGVGAQGIMGLPGSKRVSQAEDTTSKGQGTDHIYAAAWSERNCTTCLFGVVLERCVMVGESE